MSQTRWLPLESNPEVMNKYLRQLGVKKDWEFVDVFTFDQEMLSLIPRPVVAVLLLFPLSEQSQGTAIGKEVEAPEVYFIKQSIGNACGTIGLIHALLNNADQLGFDKEKHLSKFLGDTKNLTPQERGKLLESDSAFEDVHEEVAKEGQTRVPSRHEKVDLHFVAFVHYGGTLYELDGRRNGPVSHGATTEETLLEDSIAVVKKFMERDPTNLNFTVVALAKA